MSPITATLSPETGAQTVASAPAVHVQHLLALARLGKDLVLRHDEAVAAGRGDKQLAARLVHQKLDRVCRFLDVDHQAEGLAMAPAPRQLVGAERIEAAIGGEQQQRVCRLRLDCAASAGRLP